MLWTYTVTHRSRRFSTPVNPRKIILLKTRVARKEKLHRDYVKKIERRLAW